jgi:hemolysin activation/secretion protein
LASKNLDSSQQFYLGGPTGVRAYPVGQGAGSQGAIMQLELHQQVVSESPIGSITAYGFYDLGGVQLFKNTWNNCIIGTISSLYHAADCCIITFS